MRRASAMGVLFLTLGAGTAVQALELVGPEFQVNTFTGGADSYGQLLSQYSPAVAGGSAGTFVVVWQSYLLDGDDYGIFAQRYASDGTPLGTEFQVNETTTGAQRRPAVAASSTGDFVVAWESSAAGTYDIVGRSFGSDGVPIGGEFAINADTSNAQTDPALALGANGDFLVTWASMATPTKDIFARLFQSDGTAVGPDFLVNTYTPFPQNDPAVAADPNGGFVLAWTSAPDGPFNSLGIFARRFASDGTALGDQFQVNSFTARTQRVPAIAESPAGDFVVTWQSAHNYTFDIFARTFTSDGTPTGVESLVNEATADTQASSAIAGDGQGNFVVVWQSYIPSGSGGSYEVMARHLDAGGAPVGSELQVNSFTSYWQRYPAIAEGQGEFLVAWQSENQDGFGNGIFAQRLALAAPTSTPVPTATASPAPTSSPTPVPTDTPTPQPTATPLPTDTPTPQPTATPVPTDTATPLPTATDTPLPTSTPTAVPTATPPPTATPTVPVVQTPTPTVVGETCQGKAVTIAGTSGGDLIYGTPGDDVIAGFGGSDTIYGGGGNDTICGGKGHDVLYGEDGDDVLDGGEASDECSGGPGENTLIDCEKGGKGGKAATAAASKKQTGKDHGQEDEDDD